MLAEWGRCRFLWNEAVHQHKSGNKPTLCGLSRLLTQARGRFGWLRAGSQVAQQQMLRNYSQSLNHSFKVKGRGRPKFKSHKKTNPSLEYTRRGFTIREGRLRLPGGVSIPVVWSRDLPAEPTSVRKAPSNGYQRAKRAAAKLHREAANQNKHDARVWAKSVVDNHQLIAVEDFKARVILATAERIRAGVDDVRHSLHPLQGVVGAVRVRNPPASAEGNR